MQAELRQEAFSFGAQRKGALQFDRLPEGWALDMRHCLPDKRVEEASRFASLASRAHCDTKWCCADPGPSLPLTGPGHIISCCPRFTAKQHPGWRGKSGIAEYETSQNAEPAGLNKTAERTFCAWAPTSVGDPKRKCMTPLDEPARFGYVGIIEILKQAGAKCGTNDIYSKYCRQAAGSN